MTLGAQLSPRSPRAIGAPLDRIDGPLKVTGTARYAYEYPVAGVCYVWPVQSTIAKGRIVSIDAQAARALPGVLAVLSHENAPRVRPAPNPALGQHDQDLDLFQSDAVAYRGQVVAAVVAETVEVARQAASLVAVRYEEQPYDVELRADRADLYAPETLVQGMATDTAQGDVETALAAAPVTTDHTYTTPAEHNNPLEPHATIAVWDSAGASVTLYDANQGADWIRDGIAAAFALPPERVRIIAPYVGGGFGSKAFGHPHIILAVMAARVTGRPVKVALTRQQMFALTGYRSPTTQRICLGAERDGHLTAIAHDVVAQTTTLFEFAEVHVSEDTGEVRVPRLLGVFAVGRVINPKTARSQLLGGMTMGLSMALHEQSVLDPHFGDFVNHDFSEYHIATNADVGTVDVAWIDEDDPHVNPLGAKPIGETGIVGTAAAIANAVYHATGVRVRDLPITLDKLLR